MEAEDFTDQPFPLQPNTDECKCIGHTFPDVYHIVACCDKPHITQEEYQKKFGTGD